MPFLKRDFAIFLSLVAFLVAGIVVTGTKNLFTGGQSASVIKFVDSEEVEKFGAVVAEDVTTSQRAVRLEEMTDKVKSRLAASPVISKPAVTESAKKPNEDKPIKVGEINTCSEYARINPLWNPSGLKFDVVEGALLVYRERVSMVEEVLDLATTTEPSLIPKKEREVVLQLPYRSYSSGSEICLATDIVGVALDGSLIRNSDYTAYQIFGSETQVGYALDGFPIYGTATFATDSCGGADTSGFYRYYLNKDRKGVIGCFSATPVNIN